jgi:hypothetical protein
MKNAVGNNGFGNHLLTGKLIFLFTMAMDAGNLAKL